MPTENLEGFALVPVPHSRVLDVYAFLSADAASSTPASANALEGWDAAGFGRHVGRASETIQSLVRYLSERAGAEVSVRDAAEALGLPHGWNSLAGALGAFGRYCGNRDLDFPWEYWYDGDGLTVMRMSEDVAAEARKAGF
jgi:hypothetical protein